MSTRLVTPATTYPVSLEQAKAQCRVDGTDDDIYITALLGAASAHIESLTGRKIMAQTWEYLPCEFADEMELPFGPVSSVTSVKYFDASAVEQTLSASVYSVDLVSDPPRILLADDQAWPTVNDGVNQITIRFVSGYAVVPPPIYQACQLLVAQWYDQRAGVSDKPITETPNAVKALLYPLQLMTV